MTIPNVDFSVVDTMGPCFKILVSFLIGMIQNFLSRRMCVVEIIFVNVIVINARYPFILKGCHFLEEM
ncbi:hypothetical protein H5410_051309 [Solanum commersonii]|uniref:Uncharacterized protein n=1 Tax=Solanum commersonii TaxID=4109 RepID=A0A9J5WY24_SOLCO|nr:hypothetical protein H5410_051309 [Solanum commersonii]